MLTSNNDPARLLTLLITLMVYMGLIDFVLHMLIYRDLNPARIWNIAADDLFNVVARAGVLVAIRAVLLSAAAASRSPAETLPAPGLSNASAGDVSADASGQP